MKIESQLAASLLLAGALNAHADISYSQRITVDAAGGMAGFSSDGTVVTRISGDRARIDNDFQAKSTLSNMMGGIQQGGAIVRLDRGLRWGLQPDRKHYEEQTFDELVAQREQSMRTLQSGNGQSMLPVTAEGCRWSDGEVEFERPRDKESIAGIKARKHIVRLHRSCEDPGTGNSCDMSWVMESWLARDIPAEKEAQAFRQAWASALGLGESMPAVEGPGAMLVDMFGANWDEVAEELAGMRGYPLRSILQMKMGGEQCRTASGQAIAMDEMWSDASTAAYNAALDQAGSEAGTAIGEAMGESLGEGIAGSIGGAAIGAAAGELIGGFTRMFKKEKEPVQAEPAKGIGADVTVFTITSEVTDWTEADIPRELFEEPAGWKKL